LFFFWPQWALRIIGFEKIMRDSGYHRNNNER
jgi:hypothetical protein